MFFDNEDNGAAKLLQIKLEMTFFIHRFHQCKKRFGLHRKGSISFVQKGSSIIQIYSLIRSFKWAQTNIKIRKTTRDIFVVAVSGFEMGCV